MPHKFHKHKLLLDEGLPVKTFFPRLNSRFDLKHLTTDFKKSGIKDPQVYKLAVKEKRLVVTFNDKDFREFADKSKMSGVIGISANLPIEQIDKKLVSLLNKSKPSDLYGKFTYIHREVK